MKFIELIKRIDQYITLMIELNQRKIIYYVSPKYGSSSYMYLLTRLMAVILAITKMRANIVVIIIWRNNVFTSCPLRGIGRENVKYLFYSASSKVGDY